MSTALAARTFEERRRRSRELSASWPFAAQVLRLYSALLDVQEEAVRRAENGSTELASLPAFAASELMPRVVEVTVAAGPEPLAGAVQGLLYGSDLAGVAAAWLVGGQQTAVERYLARAALEPVLEASPGLLPRPDRARPQLCPACGGLPQLAYFAFSDDPLLSGQRQLLCSRCSTTWHYARMTCAGCGETETSQLPVFEDRERFPHLRIDACESCRTYLLTVELARDAGAVPVVDELAAIPLDLYARERGLRKITSNLMGF